jgi:glycerol kinase
MADNYWSQVLNNRIGRRRAITATGATALGAAYLAGLAAGVWRTREEIAGHWQMDRRFKPKISADEAAARRARWNEAVERAKGWAKPVI